MNELSKLYVRWCINNKLPIVSADEQDETKLDKTQKHWHECFMDLWWKQGMIDLFIHRSNKQMDEYEEELFKKYQKKYGTI